MSDKSSVTRQEPAADASKPPKPIDHKLWLGIDIYDTQAKADPGGSKTSIDLGTFSGNPPSEQDDADKEEENKGINQLFEKRELIQTSTAGDVTGHAEE